MSTPQTLAETLRHIADAMDTVLPFWQAGNEAPADLADGFADVVVNVPPEHIEQAAQEHPGLNLGALREWAEMHIERRDHPRFFELLALLRDKGEAAAHDPACNDLFLELHRTAPPKFRAFAKEIMRDALPKASHVNEAGEPAFSVEEIAEAFGKTPEEVAADLARLMADGLMDGDDLHTGDVFPLQ